VLADPAADASVLGEALSVIASSAEKTLAADRCDEAARDASAGARRSLAGLRQLARRGDFDWVAPWAAVLNELAAAWTAEPTCELGRGAVLPVLRAMGTELAPVDPSVNRAAVSHHRALADALRASPGACHLETPFGTAVLLPTSGDALAIWLPGSQSPDDGVLLSSPARTVLLRLPDARQPLVKRLDAGSKAGAERSLLLTVGARTPLATVEAECTW
jgi:hypothetical protein